MMGDLLKLFSDEETAQMHLNMTDEEDAWECKPKQTHYIFRQPQKGLIQEDNKQCSFTILIQDNEQKMQQVKLKISLDTSEFQKDEKTKYQMFQ